MVIKNDWNTACIPRDVLERVEKVLIWKSTVAALF
jgi:hypothetical protein